MAAFVSVQKEENKKKMKKLSQFVTRFAKKGLPHTSNLPNLTIHNVRLENAIDLNIALQ